MTNELAAFPSLHAGWSLWVALALQLYATRHWVRVLGWLYALGTAIVIATHDIALMDQVDCARLVLSDGHLDVYD